jgi:hypothetical protein
MIVVSRFRKRNSKTDFVDMQIVTLISNHENSELSISELLEIAKVEMPATEWTHDVIRNSLNRLEQRGRAQSKHTIRGGVACRVPYLV